MIDSHCHIGFDQADTAEVLARAKAVGVNEILTVACSLTDYAQLISVLMKYPTIYGAFGIHPEYAETMPADKELSEKLSAHPNIVAVGECGLDYHYNPETKKIQCSAFERQIEIAHRLKKPLIIHAREADDDIITILNSANCAGLLTHGGVLHCFTGSQRLAEKALEVGFYISASGVITFKNAEAIRDVFQTVPIERLLIETDSPYMAPVPYRGKVNEPAFMIKTAEKLAEIKGLTLAEIDRITTQNFYTLFKKEVPHES